MDINLMMSIFPNLLIIGFLLILKIAKIKPIINPKNIDDNKS